MKLIESAWANTSAIFVGIVYFFCRFAIALFPGVSMAISRSWFHGFDIAEVWIPRPFLENFLLGLVSAMVLSWLGGWLFAWVYNKLIK